MSDYISRNAITQVLNTMHRYVADELTLCDTDKKFPRNEVFIVDDVYENIIEQLPPADVRENIHGEWEEVTDYKDDDVYQWHIICSVCRQRGMFESDKFCPNCGADMRGENGM